MKNKLLYQTPNLKANLLVLFFSLFLFGFSQTDSRSCGSIENFEFTNGHESTHIQNNQTYIFNDLPGHFYVKVNIHGYVQSVRYHVTNLDTNETYEIVENIVPYTFPAGNADWGIGLGTFEVTASAFSQNGAHGTQCDSETIIFTLTDEEPCTADAGTLHATADSVNLSNGSATISATPGGELVQPAGFATLYVLTSGDGLVIEQVNNAPEFTVTEAGNYTIHTFVYPETLDLSIVELGVTTGFDVNGLLIQGGGELCASLDVAGAPIHVGEEPCTADAGTLHATADSVNLSNGSATISATPGGELVQPAGFATLYVLTQGEGLVIQQVNNAPEFTVTEAGNYTIHTLVYPETLDLSIVELGVTTGFDVNGLLIQGGGELCASLDVAGAPIQVEEANDECNAFAGTLYSYQPIQCLDSGIATIYAEQVEAPIIPNGYEQLFVLTNAFNLTILDVSNTPEFEINHIGFYRIHSLVYDPSTLDLSIVQFGHTTAFDVLPLLEQGGGNICASLDVHGAVNLVLPGWFCHFFNNYFGFGRNAEGDAVNAWVNQFDSYQSFEDAMLADFTETSVYPNPVKSELNINTLLLQDEIVNYTIVDMQGRLLKRGVITTISTDKHQIDMGSLSIGTYIVQLSSEFRNFTTKVQVN